jgi:hypothetical protein
VNLHMGASISAQLRLLLDTGADVSVLICDKLLGHARLNSQTGSKIRVWMEG